MYAEAILKKGEGRTLKSGGAWVYDNEIDRVEGDYENGDILAVKDFDGFFLGWGFINTRSKITIRVMSRRKEHEITEEFLTPNPYSRPQTKLKKVKNIFVHYTANPGTSAEQNRSYFENLGVTGETSASAHFVISYDGSIVQCLPLDEMGYAVKTRNEDSISIECCYLDEDGKFTDATYQSLLKLSAWLLSEYHLKPADMRRHYDEGGKKCPLYYVEHEDAWEQFLTDLEDLKNSY